MTKSENEKQNWPAAPEYLSEKAKMIFKFYVGLTIRAPGQIALFVRGLEAMDQADEAGRLIREQGLSQTSERSGLERQNPLLNAQKEATATMIKIWKSLGLCSNTMHDGRFGYANIV